MDNSETITDEAVQAHANEVVDDYLASPLGRALGWGPRVTLRNLVAVFAQLKAAEPSRPYEIDLILCDWMVRKVIGTCTVPDVKVTYA